MTSKNALAYLNALPHFSGQAGAAYKPGLERIEQLLEAMGRPHEAFDSVHVAGTNGKGSTAALLASIGTAAGYKMGLHTSPHLYDATERMRVGGTPAPEDWLAEALARHRDAFEAVEPTFFEATVALSFLYFAEENVDLAVIEVGLGGRLDATNVLRPRLALITSIGRDHMALLGDTLAEIAREKAGIVKPDTPVLTAAEPPEAVRAIRETADERRAPLHRVQEEVDVLNASTSLATLTLTMKTPLLRYEGIRVGWPGLHQVPNTLLAVRAAEMLFEEVHRDAAPVFTGCRAVRRLAGLRGRFEVLRWRPLIVTDAAHNPDALATALALLCPEVKRRGGQPIILFGLMRDKELEAMARLLAEHDAIVWPVRLDRARALAPDELATGLRAEGVNVGPPSTVAEGLTRFRQQAGPEDALLATGSHRVVAQVLNAVADEPFRNS